MKKLRPIVLVISMLAAMCPPTLAQDVPKNVLEHIRSVSVSIECDGVVRGSGTLFERDDETWCVTANHVIDGCKDIRVCQHREGRKAVCVFAQLAKSSDEAD